MHSSSLSLHNLFLLMCTLFSILQVYARTVSSEAGHASFGPIKQLAAEISHCIPRNIQLFGENMFAVHSIEYDKLKAFFYVFAALEDGHFWLPWDHVTELSNEIGVLTVPVLTRKKVQWKFILAS